MFWDISLQTFEVSLSVFWIQEVLHDVISRSNLTCSNRDMTAINPRTVESFQANALITKREMELYRGIEVSIHALSTVEL